MAFYTPREDSYFLTEIIKERIKNKKIKVLDLGTGSGIQTKTLLEIGIPKEIWLCLPVTTEIILLISKRGQ